MNRQKTKTQLSGFKIVKCDMYHEKIQVDSRFNEPILTIQESEKIYLRNNLCSFKLRSERQGCAHSNANLNFIQLVDQLNDDDKKVTDIKTKIEQLITEIYQLDHEKGALEKEIHECSLDKLLSVQKNLSKSIIKHRELMSHLESLKNQLLNYI